MASHQTLALTLLPTITVGSGRSALELAIVTLMANSSTLCAATKRLSQATGSALKNVLIDMFGTSPGEGASVIAGNNMEGTGIGTRACREHHRQQCCSLGFVVMT